MDLEYRDKLAAEIRQTEQSLEELRKLYSLVASRAEKNGEARRLLPFVDERIPNGAARSRPSGHLRATTANARVEAALEDAGEPLLASEVKERLPMLAEATVRSSLFTLTKSGVCVRTGSRPFRWTTAAIAAKLAGKEGDE